MNRILNTGQPRRVAADIRRIRPALASAKLEESNQRCQTPRRKSHMNSHKLLEAPRRYNLTATGEFWPLHGSSASFTFIAAGLLASLTRLVKQQIIDEHFRPRRQQDVNFVGGIWLFAIQIDARR